MRCKNCGAPDPGHVCRYCRTKVGIPHPVVVTIDETHTWPPPPPRPTTPNPGKVSWR